MVFFLLNSSYLIFLCFIECIQRWSISLFYFNFCVYCSIWIMTYFPDWTITSIWIRTCSTVIPLVIYGINLTGTIHIIQYFRILSAKKDTTHNQKNNQTKKTKCSKNYGDNYLWILSPFHGYQKYSMMLLNTKWMFCFLFNFFFYLLKNIYVSNLWRIFILRRWWYRRLYD